MLSAARPPLVRLAAIDAAIRSGSYPNAKTIARQLETSHRTIQRDIDVLRNQLRAPVEYDDVRHGFYYTQPDYCLPLANLAEGEFLALMLAGQVLQQYRGLPFEQDLRRAFDRLASLLPENVRVHLADLAAAWAVVPGPLAMQDPDVIRTIALAVVAGQQLEIDYFTASRNDRSTRRVDPYRLVLLRNDWYLLAYCHRRRSVLTFATHRIRSAVPTEESFERPTDFTAEKFFAGSFGKLQGSGWNRVVVRFTPAVAARVAEKHWHSSQKTESTVDGSLLVRFTVNDLRDVCNWVLAWGADCEALRPKELRMMLCERGKRAVEMYESDSDIPARRNGRRS